MGIGGDYRVIVRGSGDGVGAFAEIVLKISWNGIKPDSLSAEVWPSESARDYVHAAT